MHGEPAGGGNLWARDRKLRCGVALSRERPGTGLGLIAHCRGAGSRYLLHSSTEDIIAFVVGNLD